MTAVLPSPAVPRRPIRPAPTRVHQDGRWVWTGVGTADGYEGFADALRAAMAALDVPIVELANRRNLTGSAISQILSSRNLHEKTLLACADALGMRVELRLVPDAPVRGGGASRVALHTDGSEPYAGLGGRIRELRELAGLTQEQLAERAEVEGGDSAVCFYETGRREPRLATLRRIADVLNVTLDELVPR